MAAIINIDTMITNLLAAFSQLTLMVTAMAYLIGIGLIARGLMMYKAFGQQVTQMSQRGEVAGPMVYIMVGAMMVYLPTSVEVGLMTIYGDKSLGNSTEILTYASGISLTDKWNQYATVLVKYMQLIGLIAFVRGMIILSKMGQQGTQPGALGKGITHVFGGVILINIVDTIHVLATTFGFSGI